MSHTVSTNGRLGNQIIRNLAVSIVAKKFDLFVDYSSYDLIKSLGIDLFIGKNKYESTILLDDGNYFSMLGRDRLESNVYSNQSYFQTRDITNTLYEYLHTDIVKNNIIVSNPYKERYNYNNDIFIHIRLTDVADKNPGFNYYLKTISDISRFDRIIIASDDLGHPIIKQIMSVYPNVILFNNNEITTIQFGSTCKHVILSHGSFSAAIGYLAYYSNVYYPKYDTTRMWYGDIFSIDGWNCVEHV